MSSGDSTEPSLSQPSKVKGMGEALMLRQFL